MDLKLTCLVVFLVVGLGIAADEPSGAVGDLQPTESETTKHSTPDPGAKKETAEAKVGPTVKPTPKSNDTDDNGLKGTSGMYQKIIENKGMLMRTFYVLIGVTSIVVLYFVVRAWRTKRRHSKSRKYGLITSSGADLEMEPLDQNDDDDDEMTMFERRK